MKIKNALLTLMLLFPVADTFSQGKESRGFAVLELFTSQGCSSCPAADEVLGKYALSNDPNIFPLAFHVDYWNRIGWKDPFSSSEYSDRQRLYSESLNTNTYTPQLVINGAKELVGSSEKNVAHLIDTELKTAKPHTIEIVSATLSNGRISVKYNLSGQKNGYLNGALVKKKMTTNVKRGENSGRTLVNYNIVYDFISVPIGAQKLKELSFDFKDKTASEYCVIIYTQQPQAGKIMDAAKSDIK